MEQDGINQYRAEIERLNNEYTKAFERLKSQQQEIIVLERENAELYSFKRKLEDELIENGWAEYVDDKVLILSEAVEQARKETAEKILKFVAEHSDNESIVWLLEDFLQKELGVEV